MVNTTINKFGKRLPPVKTGQRFGEEIKKDKKVGLFSERRFLIFTKRGPIEIAFKPIHYASVLMTTVIGLTSIIYWSAKGIYSAIDVAKHNDIITEASANISSPIENDSDTIDNANIQNQSNISLPILKNYSLFEKNNNIIYQPLIIPKNNEKDVSKSKLKNINDQNLKIETDKLNYKKNIARNYSFDLFNKTMRNQDLPLFYSSNSKRKQHIYFRKIKFQ